MPQRLFAADISRCRPGEPAGEQTTFVTASEGDGCHGWVNRTLDALEAIDPKSGMVKAAAKVLRHGVQILVCANRMEWRRLGIVSTG